jgi:hypothetical protein
MAYLWVSDLHVKPASSYRKTLLTGDAFYALDQIEAYAIEHKVTDVILGGDTYDSNQPPGESSNRVAALVRNLLAHGIRTLYIEGNHDKVNKNPYLPEKYYQEHRLLSSIGAVPLVCADIGGQVIRGIDYCSSDKLLQKLEVLEPCDVLCIHAGFRHMLGFEGAYDLEKSDIPAAVKSRVLVGHVHTNDESSTDKGVTVKFAIHPVAGRMPGHMNVLLAEAGVPYDMIYDMDDVNADFKNTTVALVIGANDVVNPSAKNDTSSPLYGMPILDAMDSDNVIVIKRGRGAGFSGVENPLFFADNTKMLFGDGQKAASELIQAVKEL